MKIALISDIHGNLQALEAVLMDIAKVRVDKIACLGDIVTLGPNPSEVLSLIRGLNSPCIVGNHEQAVFAPDRALEYDIQSNLFSTIRWCLERLTEDDLAFLQASTPTALIEADSSSTIFLYHGSPRSSTEGIYPDTSHDKLDELFSGLPQAVKVAAGGHTHVQMLRQHRHLQIINPGSVGCAFLHPPTPKQPPKYYPFAEYAIVTLSDHGTSVDLRQISYDVRSFAASILDSSLPLRDWWAEEFTRLGTFGEQ